MLGVCWKPPWFGWLQQGGFYLFSFQLKSAVAKFLTLSRNRRLRATSPTSEATWRRRWTASRSSPPSEDTMQPTLCLGLGGTDHKYELWRTWRILNKWYRTYSFINTRYYGSKEDYDKDAQTKYDNSRRYRDPISINDRWIKFAKFAALRHLYLLLT